MSDMDFKLSGCIEIDQRYRISYPSLNNKWNLSGNSVNRMYSNFTYIEVFKVNVGKSLNAS